MARTKVITVPASQASKKQKKAAAVIPMSQLAPSTGQSTTASASDHTGDERRTSNPGNEESKNEDEEPEVQPNPDNGPDDQAIETIPILDLLLNSRWRTRTWARRRHRQRQAR
ncbi:hypothetical protein P3T76_015558 [Phytophthora citrophthora]|uniref:Uncharacterized protein n=1 Tax=Phytophthora citrophthora TaxID=4793 RepID=A0AAD9FZN2_9STRA|nr:hypothetical protein P3T76_015558 [Phytophthora citrophthora]